jgi:hypothetical protein
LALLGGINYKIRENGETRETFVCEFFNDALLYWFFGSAEESTIEKVKAIAEDISESIYADIQWH